MKISFKVINGQLVPFSKADAEAVGKLKDGAIYTATVKDMDIRTIKQNSAMHKWFAMLAEALNDRGLPLVKVLKADVMWNVKSVKNELWRPIQKAVTQKESTTKLNRDEIDKVYEVLNSNLAIKFGVSIPFPKKEMD